MQRYKYQVQAYRNDTWADVSFAAGTKSYCQGYVDAMDSMYPSPRHRIIEYVEDELIRVVYETAGRNAPHTN